MSFWTSIRNAVEGAASVVGNFYYPGSSLLTAPLTSKGSQRMLGSPLGEVANLGGGLAGLASGNLKNYGDLFRGVTSGPAAPVEDLSFPGQTNIPGQPGGPSGDFPGQLPPEGLSGLSGMPQQSAFDQLLSKFGLGTMNGSRTPMSGSGGVGSMPWGSPGNLLTMGSGLYGLLESQRLKQLSQGLGQQADPFGPFRGQYAQQLSQLSANPALIQQQPGYQAGLDAVQRSMAAQGYTGSGNMMAAIAKYGGDFYNQTLDRYSQLAGAQFNPASGAQLNLEGQIGGAQLAGNSLNRLAFGTYMAGR